jgi:flagellar export protein FliJ
MAKRFQFRLKAVQRVREQKRDQARRVVAARLRRVSRITQRITAYQHDLAEAMDRTRRSQEVAHPDLAMIRYCRTFIGAMHHAIEQAREQLRLEHEVLLDERRRLTDADREVKVLEKLCDRQWQRYRQAQQREERAESDEIALQVYGRRPRRIPA